MLFRRFLAIVLIGLAWGGAALAQEDLFVPWTQLPASDLVPGSEFGSGALLSADGSTALVVARFKDCAGDPNCGLMVYVFARDRGAWTQQATLTAPDGGAWKQTLSSAISGDGNTAILGVSNTECAAGLDCGVAYVFVRSGGVWTLQQTLTNPDNAAYYLFGGPLALSRDGNTALIGAIGVPCAGGNCGAVYVFTRSGNLWTERQKIVSGEPTSDEFFGRTIALSADGNTALIVQGFDLGIIIGKVFVYTRSGGVWSLQGTISAPDSNTDFANGPIALSGDGNLALIREDDDPFPGGGSVFVFARHGATWSPEAVLHGEPASDDFGRFPVISDDGQLAVIPTRPTGCPQLGPPCSPGTAGVFVRNGGAWNLAQRIVPPGTGQEYALGPIALSGDGKTLLLGAPGVPCAAGSRCGTVYAFTSAPLAAGIPTLGGAGLALLTIALIAAALIFLRRRRSL
jgi:FG-GAP repeat